MATKTQTLPLDISLETVGRKSSYEDPQWSVTTVNYFKESSAPPPDSLNSALSEHDIRIARRSDDSPHITPTPVKIRNIRGHESEYSVDCQGFLIARLQSQMRHWRDDEELKRVYFPEITELLGREIGARYAFQYEWHVRTGTLEEALKSDSQGKVDINGPVRRVHIDESPASATLEYHHYVQPNAPGNEHLKDRPFGIYNVWKPLSTVHRDPLCLCDARTIEDEDLQSGKVTVPNVGEIENFSIKPPKRKDSHAFVYLREQQAEEALVFRIFDSRVDSKLGEKRTHGVAHTSFVNPGTEAEWPRESVEVRSFCVF